MGWLARQSPSQSGWPAVRGISLPQDLQEEGGREKEKRREGMGKTRQEEESEKMEGLAREGKGENL